MHRNEAISPPSVGIDTSINKLVQAIKSRDLELMQQMIAHGVDIKHLLLDLQTMDWIIVLMLKCNLTVENIISLKPYFKGENVARGVLFGEVFPLVHKILLEQAHLFRPYEKEVAWFSLLKFFNFLKDRVVKEISVNNENYLIHMKNDDNYQENFNQFVAELKKQTDFITIKNTYCAMYNERLSKEVSDLLRVLADHDKMKMQKSAVARLVYKLFEYWYTILAEFHGFNLVKLAEIHLEKLTVDQLKKLQSSLLEYINFIKILKNIFIVYTGPQSLTKNDKDDPQFGINAISKILDSVDDVIQKKKAQIEKEKKIAQANKKKKKEVVLVIAKQQETPDEKLDIEEKTNAEIVGIKKEEISHAKHEDKKVVVPVLQNATVIAKKIEKAVKPVIQPQTHPVKKIQHKQPMQVIAKSKPQKEQQVPAIKMQPVNPKPVTTSLTYKSALIQQTKKPIEKAKEESKLLPVMYISLNQIPAKYLVSQAGLEKCTELYLFGGAVAKLLNYLRNNSQLDEVRDFDYVGSGITEAELFALHFERMPRQKLYRNKMTLTDFVLQDKLDLSEYAQKIDYTRSAVFIRVSDGAVFDPTGKGLADIYENRVRTINDPSFPLNTSGTSYLRALKFMAQGNQVENDLFKAMLAWEVGKLDVTERNLFFLNYKKMTMQLTKDQQLMLDFVAQGIPMNAFIGNYFANQHGDCSTKISYLLAINIAAFLAQDKSWNGQSQIMPSLLCACLKFINNTIDKINSHHGVVADLAYINNTIDFALLDELQRRFNALTADEPLTFLSQMAKVILPSLTPAIFNHWLLNILQAISAQVVEHASHERRNELSLILGRIDQLHRFYLQMTHKLQLDLDSVYVTTFAKLFNQLNIRMQAKRISVTSFFPLVPEQNRLAQQISAALNSCEQMIIAACQQTNIQLINKELDRFINLLNAADVTLLFSSIYAMPTNSTELEALKEEIGKNQIRVDFFAERIQIITKLKVLRKKSVGDEVILQIDILISRLHQQIANSAGEPIYQEYHAKEAEESLFSAVRNWLNARANINLQVSVDRYLPLLCECAKNCLQQQVSSQQSLNVIV